MRYGHFLFVFLLFSAASLHAQEWEPIGATSFEAIAGAEDGSLLLIRYPGAILRSTDTGVTWCEVYPGGARLLGFESPSPSLSPRGERSNNSEIVAYGDSGVAVVSLDSGRTWKPSAIGEAGEPSRYNPPPDSLHSPENGKINSYGFADSLYFAVGEPGLISVWDTASRRWREMHRAPYGRLEALPHASLEEASSAMRLAHAEFRTPAYGAIALGNQIFFTYDSGVTWKRSLVPDTSWVSALFLSDTFALAGMKDGSLYYITHSGDEYVRCDSVLYPSNVGGWGTQPLQDAATMQKSILQIGWKDSLNNGLFVLTDSVLYSLSADLHSSASYNLPLRMGERAIGASFPNPYVGFLLTDSTKLLDTLTSDGRDTTILRDTSYIYRSLDGGGAWALALNNIPGLSKMVFVNVHRGFACGANGILMRTDDSGSTWGHAYTRTKQNLRDVRFVNDSVGFTVGDSGTVLQTYTGGRSWRALPPEPSFTHPATEYDGIAFPNAHTVYVVAQGRGDKSEIKIPASVRMNWHRAQRNTLSVSARPDPSAGPVTFDILLAGTPTYGAMPELKVCDMSGKSLYDASGFETLSTNEWSVQADLTFLQPGPYTALVTFAGQQALAKFLIEH
jgi:photosystem II stability/assembly factor-like uncharacterized protein